MPPTASAIDLGISWDAIVGGVNAFGPALTLPVVIGVGATIAIGVAGMILSMVKRGFGRR
jgi:beta-glucosidase-like glycosyl hydrolase